MSTPPVVNTIPFPQATNQSYETPLPHTNAQQVFAELRGVSLDRFRDSDGTLTSFTQELNEIFIPEATGDAVRRMRTNYDMSREIWFFDGTQAQSLVLPRREIMFVNMAILRILPSQIWYRFSRFRNVDGSEFLRNAAVNPGQFEEPVETPPSSTLPPYTSNDPIPIQPTFTGIEDADLFVDTRSRTVIIPPRVLAATVATPFYNYTFFRGQKNIEIHYAYGYMPTKYLDGQALVFDPITGNVVPQSPDLGNELPGNAGIDWSSGMPIALTRAVARIAAARVLQRLGRAISQGLSSISVDGASESYNPKAFGADELEERAFKALVPFEIIML
jgi:hypothetical protein